MPDSWGKNDVFVKQLELIDYKDVIGKTGGVIHAKTLRVYENT